MSNNKKYSKLTSAIVAILLLCSVVVKAQPIPVELMFGNQYGVVSLSFNRSFTPTSKFGFFHMNTVQFNYRNELKNGFLLQDLIYVAANFDEYGPSPVVESNFGVFIRKEIF